MRSSIANWKENLNKIAQDVHDDGELPPINELPNGHASPYSDRRLSHSFAHSRSGANGIVPTYNSEIEGYKAEIMKLKESEAEIKQLSVIYAALLKEREDQIVKLNQEIGSLRQNVDTGIISGNGPFRGSATSPYVLKELEDMLEEKIHSIANLQASYELQIDQLRMEFQEEQEKSAGLKLQLQAEEEMYHSLLEDLNSVKLEHGRTSVEISKLHSELNEKGSEIQKLQMQLEDKEDGEVDGMEGLKIVIANLEEDKQKLQKEKEELEAAVKARTTSTAGANSYSHADLLGSSAGKDELEKQLEKIEKDLKETRRQRDKALQELARLKQHLLEKESEESQKMDEDSKIIEELQQNVEHQKARIVNLERSLQQAYVNQEEVKSSNIIELQKSKEIIDDFKEKLSGCMRVIDAKNIELLNLQTALGQYYAEIEAKEHLEGDLSAAREECAKLSLLLKVSDEQAEETGREKEEISSKLAQLERVVVEAKDRAIKLEDDNAKLWRALEQSTTRLNRMSVDSDFLVDRRIVIKLLVTYFQRNHSKEVLELMVRMLGFSDEDKQRIGIAQQGAGVGVVRGVLGFPGRIVGGILSGRSAGPRAGSTSENQSFADLWVDFLLKESEEREKREFMEAGGRSNRDQHGISPTLSPTRDPPPPAPDHRRSDMKIPDASHQHEEDVTRSSYDFPSLQQYEEMSSEFSMVPLTPSNSSPWTSKKIQRW